MDHLNYMERLELLSALKIQIAQQNDQGGSDLKWQQLFLGSFPNVEVQLKSLLYQAQDEKQRALMWYKNLIFPQITVKIDGLTPLEINSNLYEIQPLAFKFYSDNNIEQSPLKGSLMYRCEKLKVKIRHLKFSQTSYKTKECKFIIVLLAFKDKKCLSLILSQPIIIESRKKTHPEKCIYQGGINLSFFQPFMPKALEPQFYECNFKIKQKIINNDIEGLLAYLSSPSIRYKIFHPLFLFFKFHSILKIYVNNDLIKNDDDFVKNFQKQIYLHFVSKKLQDYQRRPIIMTLITKNAKKSVAKNVIKYLKCLDCAPIYFIIDEFFKAPSHFYKLEYSEQLVQQYKDHQPYLSFVQIISDVNNNETIENYASTQQANSCDFTQTKQQFHSCSFKISNKKILETKDILIPLKCLVQKQVVKSSYNSHNDTSANDTYYTNQNQTSSQLIVSESVANSSYNMLESIEKN